MTRSDLDNLIGLDVYDAELIVKNLNLIPKSIHFKTITNMLCLPKNIVRIRYDNNNKVISAETQESIDAKYGA